MNSCEVDPFLLEESIFVHTVEMVQVQVQVIFFFCHCVSI